MSRRRRYPCHGHACDVPGCRATVPCDGEGIVDDVEDGVKSGYMTCAENGPQTVLCEDHEDAVACDYCGSYAHVEAACPDAALDAPTFDESEADNRYQLQKEA